MPINAIILAAGEGTRMKSAHPKVTHKLLEKPLIWWPVHAAREAGCERIIVVIGHGAQEVRDALADYMETVLGGTVPAIYAQPQGRITVIDD